MKSIWGHFFAGLFSIFNITPARCQTRYLKQSHPGLRSDWEAVGRDIRKAMKGGYDDF